MNRLVILPALIFSLILFTGKANAQVYYSNQLKISTWNDDYSNELDRQDFNLLVFGTRPDATDGRDDSLDEEDFPGWPPAGMIHAFMLITDSIKGENYFSYNDYMAYPTIAGQKKRYIVKLNYLKSYVKIRWGEMPDFIDSAYFQDVDEGLVIKVDMKKETELTFEEYKLSGGTAFIDVWYNVPGSDVVDESKSSLKIYPNPFCDYLEINDAAMYANSYEIYDNLGKIAKKGPFNGPVNIYTGDLEKGVYFIKIIYPNGNSVIKKLIRN